MHEPQTASYREIVDELVRACQEGQGQIAANRARMGVWNVNASSEWPDRQSESTELLGELDERQRHILPSLLSEEFVSGVHTALVVLHAKGVTPFEDGYEGTPFHDFSGRLDGWPWPDD